MTGSLLLAWRYVPRSLRRGGRRALVTLACIAVGVAAVVALQVASLSVGDALTANVRAANGGDIALSSNSAPLSGADLATFQKLAAGGGVGAWTAVSRIHVTANTSDGHLIPFDAAVVDTTAYPIGGQPTFVTPAGGSVQDLLRGPGDVLVSAVLADELGAHVGDRLTVNGVGGSGLHATVRGILAQVSLEHAAVMDVRRADHAALTTAPPQYTNVYANLTGDPAVMASQLRQAFPQATVTTVAEAIANADRQVHDFHTYALIAGLVALLVAGVGIQNAMQSSLASRLTEVAMLKALGNPPRVVAGLFTAEAAVLGGVGGVLGTGIGLGVSALVTTAVSNATGVVAPPHIDAGVVLEGVALGIGATICFSVLPIIAAVAVRPIGLMRGEVLPVSRSAPRYAVLLLLVVGLFTVLASYVTGDARSSIWLVGGAVVICGALAALFAAAVAGLARVRPPARSAIALGVGAVLVAAVVASIVTAPAVTPLVILALTAWTASTVGPRRWRLWLQLAARSLDRRRTRTAVTLVALFAGALASGLTMTMASGLRDQISQAIAANGSTNLVAIASQPSRAELLASASHLQGIQASQATAIASGRVTAIDGTPVAPATVTGGGFERGGGRLRSLNGITGYDLASGSQPPSITVTGGRALTTADAGTRNVLVDQSLGGPPASLIPGSTVTLADSSSGNQISVTIVGLYHGSGLRSQLTSRYSPRVLGDTSAAMALAGDNVQTVLSLTVDPAVLDSDSVTLQHANPSALVANVNDLTVVVRTILNNLLLVLTVVTAMVVVAGVAVVANAVTLALIERAREMAMLKSVGFGPRHVRTLLMMEFGLAGFLAGAVAVVSIAVTLAILSSQVLQTPIGFSVVISAILVAAAVLVTAGTSLLVSRRDSRLRPLAALRNS